MALRERGFTPHPIKSCVLTRGAGFTLVELMVVAVILAILVAIAIPLYTGYIQRAKAEEAKSVIGALVSEEKVYRQRNGAFTDKITELGVDTGEAAYFDFAISAGVENFEITATVNKTGVANGLPSGGTVTYSYNLVASPRGSWSGTLY